jgi:hypothetical protein
MGMNIAGREKEFNTEGTEDTEKKKEGVRFGGYDDSIRRGGDWGWSVWGVDGLAFGAAGKARAVGGCLWAGECAVEFGG